MVRFVAVFLHRTNREAVRQVVAQGFSTGGGSRVGVFAAFPPA